MSAFIVSTAERGGESHDEQLAASPRAAKVKIERHVRSLGEKGLRWTSVHLTLLFLHDAHILRNETSILRPSFFMENFDGTIGSVTATVLRCGLKPTTKLQLIVRTFFLLLGQHVQKAIVTRRLKTSGAWLQLYSEYVPSSNDHCANHQSSILTLL